MKKILLDEKIFIAGSKGMAGAAILRALKKYGYGSNLNGGKLLAPDRKELNLLDSAAVNVINANQVDREICHLLQNSAMSLEKYGKLKFCIKLKPNNLDVPIAITE